MFENATLSPDGKTLYVLIPMTFGRRRGRKQIIAPPGAPELVPTPPRADPTLVKALARAHRWKKMLDSGQYTTIKQLAEAESLSDTYVANLLRLTLLAPDIIEAALDGRLPKGVGLADFMTPWPGVWAEQRLRLEALAQR